MTRRKKTAKTDKAIAQERVPKLRFPEFRNAGAWEQLPIGEKVDLLSGYPFKSSEISEDSSCIPLMRGINITEGFVRHTQDIDRFFLGDTKKLEKYKLRTNDLIIGMDGSKVGKNSALITVDDSCSLLIQRVVRLRTKSKATTQFIFQQVNSTKFHSYVNRINTSGGIPHISAKQINEFEICFPTKDEQQKIADCLSSIDELITAQAQKLDTLKAHKKGLMQQLFPAQGETVPKLRFPEFWNTGAWEEKRLGSLSQILRGGSPRPIENFLTTDVNGLNWLKIGDVSFESKYITQTQEKVIKEALSKTREVQPGDLILSNSMSFGRPYILKIKSCIHDGWIAITKIENQINRDYLYYLILSPSSQAYFLNNAAGSGVQNLNAVIIKSLPVFAPKFSEQLKIADCLSSIDELITAQAQKLDTLKAHKKGLMQQLFPSIDEVNG